MEKRNKSTASIKISIIIIICQSFPLFSQNLVPNPGFEDNIGCPSSTSQIHLTGTWQDPDNMGSSSTDYYNTCASNSFVSVPSNVCGIQPARTGDAYVGIYTWGFNCREYAETKLISSLQKGVRYKVEFYVNPVDNSGVGVDGIGAFFSQNPGWGNGTYNALPYNPQVKNPDGNIITDKDNWHLISGTFVADGGEKYIIIGNFKSDAQTQTSVYNSSGWNRGYYFIDDVSVVPDGEALGIKGDESICRGDEATLEVFGEGPFNWATENNPSVVFSNDSLITVTPAVTTTYIVFNNNDTLSFMVQVIPIPKVNLGKDTVMCEGNQLLLNATYPGASYRWQDNSLQAEYSVSDMGTYWVEVTLGGICTAYDTIQVRYNPLPVVDLGPDTALCPEQFLTLNGAIHLTDGDLLWQDQSGNPEYIVDGPGVYWVIVTQNNCSASDTIEVTYDALPEVNLGNDTTICEGDFITFNVAHEWASSYQWSDNSTGPEFIATGEEGLYHVALSNRCGSVMDTIQVISEGFSCSVYVPNAFSPNGDGINDEFKPVFHSTLDEYIMNIFDRWGRLIFTSGNMDKGWDGTFRGEPVRMGVYVWQIEYAWERHDRVKQGFQRGSVTVVR